MDNKQIDEKNKALEKISEEESLSKLKSEYKIALKNIGKFNISNAEIEHSIALQYYSRILELTKGIIINLENDKLKSVTMPLIRCMLEAFVELINISNINGYRYYIIYKTLDNKIRLSEKKFFKKSLCKEEKDYLKKRNECINILKEKYFSTYFIRTKKYGEIRLLSGKQFEFGLAKHKEIYDTMYWVLCSDTHNDISSLSLEYKNNENFYNIKCFNRMEVEEIKGIIATLICILEQSNNHLYKKFNLI